MSSKLVKDNSVLAKLFAEEDIHLSYKQVHTASFDVHKRELTLPIMKEMTKDIQDLMTLHEVGHALWTSMDMIEEAVKRKLDHSFVNVLEDVRIEKFIQTKYKGAKRCFVNGYKQLISNNFFKTEDRDINKSNLIDRINLHYKHHSNIHFSDEEMVWVNKAKETKTEKDVLDLAEELHAYMLENMPEEEESEFMSDMSAMSASTDMNSDDGADFDNGEDSGEQELKEILTNIFSEESEETENQKSSNGDSETSDEEGKEETSDNSDSEKSDNSGDEQSELDSEKDSKKSDNKNLSGGSGSDLGKKVTKIVAATDQATHKSLQEMRNYNANSKIFVNIPKVNLENVIIDYNETLKMFNKTYDKSNILGSSELRYYDKTLEELNTTFKNNKKTISYMVKEFEMKKAADQYARASVAKTGSLDMGRLHTYKYNDDLFRKVTTLPGATNHGFVLFLDWSGSMAWNLTNTIKQLFNIVHFCNRVKIPFEVYAFSTEWVNIDRYTKIKDLPKLQKFKVGDLKISETTRLLNMLSSNMTKNEQNKMMHNLLMFSNSMVRYRDWTQFGYPIYPARCTRLGGTPLNDAIVCAMDILPQFKKNTGVQKVHSIFLTDGDSNNISSKFDLVRVNGTPENGEYGEGTSSFRTYANAVYSDHVTNTKLSQISDDAGRDWRRNNQTIALLQLLKKRVDGMNVVGFFVANSTKGGSISKDVIESKFGIYKHQDWVKYKSIIDEVKKTNVAVCTSEGYDEFYIVPGQVKETTDELDVEVGANKGALKRAFMKSANNRMKAKPMLNKFISMVA